MGDLTKKTRSSIAENAAVNPDGKGLSGFMLHWYATTPRVGPVLLPADSL